MTRARLRRRARVLAGRSLRLLRTHFFSFVSAAVIGGVFVFAMTSSAFTSVEGGSQPKQARADASRITPRIFVRPASIIYYIVDSDTQRQAIINAMHDDQEYRFTFGSDVGPDEVDFFIARNAEEDVIVAGLVENALEVARENGIGLRVIDVRAGSNR